MNQKRENAMCSSILCEENVNDSNFNTPLF